MHALPPPERAAFATNSRLLSCLVTESLVRAFYIPVNGSKVKGVCVVLSGQASASSPVSRSAYAASDILAIVPLRHVPIFKSESGDPLGREIGLLDPFDMLPFVFEVRNSSESKEHDEQPELRRTLLRALSGPGWTLSNSPALVSFNSPIVLWNKYAQDIDMESALNWSIADELASSVHWQTYSYEHPPPSPSLESPSIDWEQSIVEGHHYNGVAWEYVRSHLMRNIPRESWLWDVWMSE